MWKLMLPVVMLSSGCVIGGRADSCAGWKPVIVSEALIEAMTEAQAKEILAHNEFGVVHCGWKPVG